MALVVADRVQETSVTSGTGTLTLDGALAGYQSFSTAIGNGNTTFYTIYDPTAFDWEVGIGTIGAGTLARTTVLSNSAGTTSPISFASNTKFVFCTYPSEKSVNLNASGNVGPLGTISSGTWQGTTIGVAYGGTGVTTSSGANSVVLRDSNQNITANRVNQSNTTTTSTGGTTALTAASSYIHTLVSTNSQTYKLPDATTLTTGVAFIFNNLATGNLIIEDYANGPLGTIPSGGAGAVFLTANATVAGTWDLHGYLPEGVTWGTTALNLGTSVITGGTWNGGTIDVAYGGTGLTTFSAANNALYSTGATTLTAGTLPVAAGGSGATTFTANGILYGSGTSALGVTAAGTTGQVLLANTSGAPTWGAIPTTAAVTSISFGSTGLTPNTATTGVVTVAGTLAIANGGTGETTRQAAIDALAGAVTSGQYLRGNGTDVVMSTIQVADVPTLNQNTTGSAATLTTPRAIYGNNFDGSANLTQIIASTYGGTGNGFTKFSGPTTSEKTFTLPNATATILTTNAAVTIAQGGTGTTTAQGAMNTFAGAVTSGSYLRGNGTNVVMATIQAGDVPTLNQNTTGNAGTVTNGLYTTGNQTIAARTLQQGSQNVGTMLTATGSLGGLELVNPGGANAAFMAFHRSGAYASYFGLDIDSQFAVGGWSAGAALANMKVGSFGVGTAASGTAGEIRATNNVTAYYSDARLKDFKGTIPNALAKVLLLNGYYFTENEKAKELGYNNDKVQVGVSAQEVEAVLPEVVTEAPISAEYKTVYYDKLVPLLIEAIKELKAEIDELKGK